MCKLSVRRGIGKFCKELRDDPKYHSECMECGTKWETITGKMLKEMEVTELEKVGLCVRLMLKHPSINSLAQYNIIPSLYIV